MAALLSALVHQIIFFGEEVNVNYDNQSSRKLSKKHQQEVLWTSKCSLVAGLFTEKFVLHNQSGDLSNTDSLNLIVVSVSGSKRKHDKIINYLNVGNELIDQIVNEKESPQVYGPPTYLKLYYCSYKVLVYWGKKWLNNLKIQEWLYFCIKLLLVLCSNTERNERIIRNKGNHYYYKLNDKLLFRNQSIGSTKTAVVTDLVNSCLDSDKKNTLIHSRDVELSTS